MTKRFLSLLLLTSSLLLSGCFGIGGSGDVEQVSSEDGFFFSIPGGYTQISPKLVENKQIINKILLSYQKEVADDELDGFRDNIVVTRAELGPDINYEQFRSLNSRELFTGLVGYSPKEQKRVSFECGESKIAGLLVSFDLKNIFSEVTSLTYVSQYQFVTNGKGYIVSYASESEKDRDASDKRITTISCTANETEN